LTVRSSHFPKQLYWELQGKNCPKILKAGEWHVNLQVNLHLIVSPLIKIRRLLTNPLREYAKNMMMLII
jgi:hypothetical protein